MAVSFVSYTAEPSNSTGNVTITYPVSGILAGDMLFLIMSLKSTAAVVTLPTGYTLLSDVNVNVGTDGPDSGPVRCVVYYKLAAGTENGTTFTLTVTTATGYATGLAQYRNATGLWDMTAMTTETQSTSTTPFTTVGNLGSAVVGTGDVLLHFNAANTDTFSMNTPTRTFPAGITGVTFTERQDRAASTGNDTRTYLGEFAITAGSGSGNFSTSAVIAGAPVGDGIAPFYATIILRLKETAAGGGFTVKNLGLLGIG